MREFPKGYPPSSFCRSCGRDFVADKYFFMHRVGNHEYTYLEGLELGKEDGRRCMDAEELHEIGLRLMTNDEMIVSKRHSKRANYGVPLWFDPNATNRLGEAHSPA